jgi:hypothetical protein
MDFVFDAEQTLRRVEDVLRDRDVPWPADNQEQQLLRLLLAAVGKDRAISRDELAMRTGRPDRVIRRQVRTLRENFRVAIGSNRSAGHSGYYLVATAEEARELSSKIFAQAFSLLRLGRALGGKHATTEFFGQARIDLGLEAVDAHE